MSPDRRRAPREEEPDLDNIAIVDAHRTYLFTLMLAVAFIGVVITFIN